jgi:transposase
MYRGCCPDCGVRTEKVPQLTSNAPFSKRFEDTVGVACESAPLRRVAQQFGMATSWSAERKRPVLRQMGVDEIYPGRQQKFLTVVTNLETGEPVWMGRGRKQETLDEFFQTQLSAFERSAIQAACVDMWLPFRQSIEQWAPQCRLVYDKFHILQHANAAVDEVRRAEFFRKGGAERAVVKGKRWVG